MHALHSARDIIIEERNADMVDEHCGHGQKFEDECRHSNTLNTSKEADLRRDQPPYLTYCCSKSILRA